MALRFISRASALWKRLAVQEALAYCPPLYPCADCGGPVISGYSCKRCGSIDPKFPTIVCSEPVRRYERWHGNPDGVPENEQNCIAVVRDEGNSLQTVRGRQCGNRRGFGLSGLYCNQHALKRERDEQCLERQSAVRSQDAW